MYILDARLHQTCMDVAALGAWRLHHSPFTIHHSPFAFDFTPRRLWPGVTACPYSCTSCCRHGPLPHHFDREFTTRFLLQQLWHDCVLVDRTDKFGLESKCFPFSFFFNTLYEYPYKAVKLAKRLASAAKFSSVNFNQKSEERLFLRARAFSSCRNQATLAASSVCRLPLALYVSSSSSPP